MSEVPKIICPICQDSLDESAESLACFHVYHKACIDAWFKTQTEAEHDSTCPECRHVIKKIAPDVKTQTQTRTQTTELNEFIQSLHLPASRSQSQQRAFFVPDSKVLVTIGLAAAAGALSTLVLGQLQKDPRRQITHRPAHAPVSYHDTDPLTIHPELPFEYQKKPFNFETDF